MVGLLSGMENEGLSSVVQVDVNVGAVQEQSNADESQSVAGNTDNEDEVEHVKELKSILKRRGQYTFRKVKVDFDLIPTKIPYDEDEYTAEIQIIEKEPIRIKSWAAIFAAKKAEAEAEAAAIAEAEEALKKAEEQQKREALKKANKAKLKKTKELSESSEEASSSSPTEQNEQETASTNISPVEQALQQLDPESSYPSAEDRITSTETNANQEKSQESNDQEETTNDSEPNKMAECIVNDLLDKIIIPEELASQDANLESKEDEPHSEQKDEEESSCTESLLAERSENLQQEHTNDDLEEISTHDETSVSQLLDDSNTEGSSCYDVGNSDASHNKNDLEEKSDASVSHSEDNSSNISHSEDSSSKLVELQGKQVPKKVLVTAASIVEDILSEMPEVIKSESKDSESSKQSSPTINEKNSINKSPKKDAALGLVDSNLANDLKNKSRDPNLESGARRKSREFKKTDSKIFEHVKRSLDRAAPEILETAVGVLDEIEKIVVDKVGSTIS